MPAFAIGVDLGGTNLRIAAVDQHGKLLEKITTGTEVTRGRDQVIHEMCTAIRDLLAKFRGAGHLAGKDSVIALLQRDGYRVRRVQ